MALTTEADLYVCQLLAYRTQARLSISEDRDHDFLIPLDERRGDEQCVVLHFHERGNAVGISANAKYFDYANSRDFQFKRLVSVKGSALDINPASPADQVDVGGVRVHRL
jgi:hypothetical protein